MTVPPGVRPTESRVREALFSIWSARIQGARFLDLFAGSGVVGLEALSRGAAEVQLVEADRRVVRVIEASLAGVGESGWKVLCADIPDGLARLKRSGADLVFADPPYEFPEYDRLIAAVAGILSPDGALAVEHSVRVELPQDANGLLLEDERRYGDSALTIYGF